jgi:hypothetical protein
MATTTSKTFKPLSKDIKYLNRDFAQLRESLVNFAKVYFPNTYKDFNDASPGMMFVEMAAYVGDVLSYYTDYVFNEGLINTAKERKNIISLARYLGYKVKPTRAATAKLDIFQLIPAKENDSGEFIPDEKYALIIRDGMEVANSFGSNYILNESVDFSTDTNLSPRESTVYSRDASGQPTFFLLKKTVNVSSGKTITKSFNIDAPTPFLKLSLDETNVLEILDVRDSDNNKWYEVDHLAQELVLDSVPNDAFHEGNYSTYKAVVPYILKYLRTSKRFTVNVNENNGTFLEFGAGKEGFTDEIVNLSSQMVGSGLSKINRLNIPYDPSSFLKNETYGIAPANTVLTITYTIGGGVLANCPSGDITKIVSVSYDNTSEGLSADEASLLNTVKSSLKVNNAVAATGGKDSETNDEIRLNALASHASQNRAVTRDDYLVRIYSMPPKFGSIAKAQVIPNNSLSIDTRKVITGFVDTNDISDIDDNDVNTFFRRINHDVNVPFAINLYLLSYDADKHLIAANDALIENLIKYLRQFRILTDGINFIDGYIINIGVEMAISVYKGFNKKNVILNCINAVKSFFDIDKWDFAQPINISMLELEVAKIDGVQAVVDTKIVNKNAIDGSEYSKVEYNIKNATKNKMVYSSVDPSIFELKFPDKDIKIKAL